MNPSQFAAEAENAYDARDRPALYRALTMLVALASPPDIKRLTREQLELRRDVARTELAQMNDRLIAMQQAGRRTVSLPTWPSGSLDPSDPTT